MSIHNAHDYKYLRRRVRARSTYYERMIWERVRDRRLGGYKIRRNHQILSYYVDFYCHKRKLVIEVDGSIHQKNEQREYDLNRTQEINSLGISVIRFTNEEVLSDLEEVLEKILNCLNHPSF